MTYVEIDEMMQDIAQTIGCPYSYYTNDEAQVVKAPFLLFDYRPRRELRRGFVYICGSYTLFFKESLRYGKVFLR